MKGDRKVIQLLNKALTVELTAIAECENARDFVTREILVPMLDDTEDDHTHWLEQQLGLVRLMGRENCIQSQTGGLRSA